MPNAGDRGTQARARRDARKRDREDADFWLRALSDPIGRRCLWDILQSTHAFDERFGVGPNGFPQPEATWMNAGEQRAGFRLYRSWMRYSPEGVLLMMQENDPLMQRAVMPRRAGDLVVDEEG